MECAVRSQNRADDTELLDRLLQTVDGLLESIIANQLDQQKLAQTRLNLLLFKSVALSRRRDRMLMQKPRVRVKAAAATT